MSANSILPKIKNFFTDPRFIHTVIAVAVFAIISCIFFFPDIIDGNVLSQHDVRQGIANGQEVKAFAAATGETSRWTGSLFSGMPNFQISPSYKNAGLISIVSNAWSLWLPSPANLVFIMILGFYLMLLAFRVRWYLAIPGAIAWGFSTYFFILIGAGHIWKYITLAYIPPTIAGIVWTYRGKYLTGGAVAALFTMLQISGNHVQMTYYSLIPIIALAIAFLVIAIKEGRLKEWLVSSGILIVAALLGVAANVPNLYNSYKYTPETMRGGHSELTQGTVDANASSGGLDRDYITQWSYGIDETFTLLVPNLKGGASLIPQKGNNIPLTIDQSAEGKKLIEKGEISYNDAQAIASVPFYQYFGDQPMTNGPVYVGALIFVLFLIGCFIVKGPVKWALLIATILSIFLSWGHNMMWFTNIFIDYVPMYNKFRTVSSILVVAELTMPLLGILALQKILENPDTLKTHAKAVYGSFIFTILLCMIIALSPSILIGQPYSEPEVEYLISRGLPQQYPSLFAGVEKIRFAMVESDAWRSLGITIIGLAIILLFAFKKINAKIAALLFTCIVVIDLYPVNKRYINHESFMEAPANPDVQFTPRAVDAKILQDTAMNYRVLDIPGFGDATASYFHKTIGGYHAAKLRRYQDIINYYFQFGEQPRINPAVMNMLNARYVIFDNNTVEMNPEALGNAWMVDTLVYVETPKAEIESLANFNPATTAYSDRMQAAYLGDEGVQPKAPGDTIFETSYVPNRLTYHANSAAGNLVVFSEIYFPWGWKATVDGTEVPIGRVNYILRAIRIPAGQHTIEFVFDPDDVNMAENVSIIAVVIIYLALLAMIFIPRKKKPDTLPVEE